MPTAPAESLQVSKLERVGFEAKTVFFQHPGQRQTSLGSVTLTYERHFITEK